MQIAKSSNEKKTLNRLLASFRLRKDLFNVILFLICWLPLQNLVLVFMKGILGFPGPLVAMVSSVKEILVILTLLYLILSRRMRLENFNLVDLAVLAYFLWTSLYFILPDALFSTEVGMTGRIMGYRAAIIPVTLYYLGRFIPLDRNRISSSIRLVLLLAIGAGIFGVVERFCISNDFWIKASMSDLPTNFYAFFGNRYLRRAVSTYFSPLTFGFVNIFVVPLMSYYFFNSKSGVFRTRLGRLGSFVTIVFAQLLTLTRAAILANMFSIGIFLVSLRKIRIKIVMISLPLFIILIFTTLTQTIYHQTRNLSDPSSGGHMRALQKGLTNIMANPMGYGLGQGGYVGGVYGQALAGESLYFSIAVERGVIGLVLFMVMVFTIISYCHGNRRYLKNDKVLYGLAWTIVASTFGYLIASITTEHWQAFVSSGIYWIYTGITVQVIRIYKKSYSNLTLENSHVH